MSSLAEWQALFERWRETNERARTARGTCTARFQQGNEPTQAHLDEADAWEALADDLARDLHNFVRQNLA